MDEFTCAPLSWVSAIEWAVKQMKKLYQMHIKSQCALVLLVLLSGQKI